MKTIKIMEMEKMIVEWKNSQNYGGVGLKRDWGCTTIILI